MDDESQTEFEFGVTVDQEYGQTRDETRSSARTSPGQPASPPDAHERADTAVRRAAETTAAGRQTPDSDPLLTILERLGAALYYYDTRRLDTLAERAAADPNPPPNVEAVLPLVEQLVAS